MNLILFDFDKTLTFKDSFIEFLKFAIPKRTLIIKGFFLFPHYLLYKFNLYSAEKFKIKVLTSFFYNQSQKQMQLLGLQFSTNKIPKILNKELVKKLDNHITKGDKVVLVSASLDIWLKPWAESKSIDLICTQLYFNEEIFKGSLYGTNCNGPEKKVQVTKQYDLKSYSKIICYGNKGGDDELLSLASSNKHKNII